MAMCALLCVCLWPRWMAKYLVGGQVSCSSSCQQKEEKEKERRGIKGGARQLAVVRWKLTPRYKITNVEINFINFRCFPLGETGTFSLLD